MPDLILQGATVVPMDGPPEQPLGTVAARDVRIRDGRIAEVGQITPTTDDIVQSIAGLVLAPGFVHGHVHYCQTLFRGLADDLPLLDWLVRRIWPLEAAHDPESTRASAELSVAELLRGGATAAQVMESVHHAEVSLEVAATSGMTTILGNCLMDRAGPDVPAQLTTTADAALAAIEQLSDRCRSLPTVDYAVSPRFVLSCSDELSRAAAAHAVRHDLRIHTHADEHPDEGAAVRAQLGRDAIEVLHDQGLLGPRTSLAHCVHTTARERAILVETGTRVVHCPSTNLKLGSGIAPIAEYQARGIPVALGADGAPCNNRLCMLTEVRQAALLQALSAGPGRWPAAHAWHAATRGGAEVLGLADRLGSIRVGLRADLVAFDLGDPTRSLDGDLVSRLVYSAQRDAVRHVWVAGTPRVRDGVLLDLDHEALQRRAAAQLRLLLSRAGMTR